MNFCVICKQSIPIERLEALSDTDVCVSCSNENKVIGIVQATCEGKGYTLEVLKADSHAASIVPKRYKHENEKCFEKSFKSISLMGKSYNSINAKYPL